MTQTTLANMRENISMPPAVSQQTTAISMNTVAGFESLQRVAKLFASSRIVPPQYQNNLPDCVIAVDMALRMGANPLMVCQNLYIVYERPAWSAKFLIATLNQSGRFSALRYVFQGKQGEDNWGCRAVAVELSSGERLEGPLITIDLAKKEGWYEKKGSKWKTMPEMMLRYRAASWFVNAYAPEIAMGLRTVEEEQDAVYDVSPDSDGTYQVTTSEIRRPEPADVEPEAVPEEPKAAPAEKPAPPKRRTAPAKENTKAEAPAAPAEQAAPAQQEPAPEDDGTGPVAPAGEVFDDPFDGGGSDYFITCPNNNKLVDELDCQTKSCRNGCPAFLD